MCTDFENWKLIEPNNTLNLEDNLEQQTIQKGENKPYHLDNHKRKSPFCDDGFTDWQHLNPRISEHELIIQNEKRKWRNILKTVSYVILFCAKNNLPLRGSSEKEGDDNCGIFLGLIELISQYDPLLAEHLFFSSYSK
ncbi:zinc finger MYM-type protein 1-like [Aphis craccivora]|uniref:Zinc finger MYM-type protein 1-like n=1 Tax=Aphis craccivora TaxID=307492 RepID=A0A6G0Y5F0_APHCR|nr:zinc finger MYM-type protein 1-like [Aphis craccivora]